MTQLSQASPIIVVDDEESLGVTNMLDEGVTELNARQAELRRIRRGPTPTQIINGVHQVGHDLSMLKMEVAEDMRGINQGLNEMEDKLQETTEDLTLLILELKQEMVKLRKEVASLKRKRE